MFSSQSDVSCGILKCCHAVLNLCAQMCSVVKSEREFPQSYSGGTGFSLLNNWNKWSAKTDVKVRQQKTTATHFLLSGVVLAGGGILTFNHNDPDLLKKLSMLNLLTIFLFCSGISHYLVSIGKLWCLQFSKHF